MAQPEREGETIYRGIAVSAGVARGKTLVLRRTQRAVTRAAIAEGDLPGEVRRLEAALIATRKEILDVQRQVTAGMGAGDASIFEAHLLVLEDHTLIDEVTRLMEHEQVNVEYAWHSVAEKYAAALGAIADEYLRERASEDRKSVV